MPDANDIEQPRMGDIASPEQPPSRLNASGDRDRLKKLIIGLLGFGLLLGALTATGVVWTIRQLNLAEPPAVEDTL